MGVSPGGGYDTSLGHMQSVLADYLRILNTTYVDLVLIHRQDYLLDANAMTPQRV